MYAQKSFSKKEHQNNFTYADSQATFGLFQQLKHPGQGYPQRGDAVPRRQTHTHTHTHTHRHTHTGTHTHMGQIVTNALKCNTWSVRNKLNFETGSNNTPKN
jgi:hypothetical protein